MSGVHLIFMGEKNDKLGPPNERLCPESDHNLNFFTCLLALRNILKYRYKFITLFSYYTLGLFSSYNNRNYFLLIVAVHFILTHKALI